MAKIYKYEDNHCTRFSLVFFICISRSLFSDLITVMWQSLYVHIPARHPSSFPELELPTLLQVSTTVFVSVYSASHFIVHAIIFLCRLLGSFLIVTCMYLLFYVNFKCMLNQALPLSSIGSIFLLLIFLIEKEFFYINLVDGPDYLVSNPEEFHS